MVEEFFARVVPEFSTRLWMLEIWATSVRISFFPLPNRKLRISMATMATITARTTSPMTRLRVLWGFLFFLPPGTGFFSGWSFPVDCSGAVTGADGV